MFSRLLLLAVVPLVLATLAMSPQPAPQPQQCANALISTPRSGAVVRGNVDVTGSASIDRFQFYKVEFSPINNPDNWQAVSQVVRRPIINGRLDVWNSRVAPDGLYNLKLTVVDERGQEVCRSVVSQIQVANSAPTATPTEAATATPTVSPTPPVTPTPSITPTAPPLPTIPPAPTLPPPAQPAAPAAEAKTGPTAGPRASATPAPVPTRSASSLIPDLSGVRSAFDVSRMRDAFLLGAITTIATFTFIGLVLLLRRLL